MKETTRVMSDNQLDHILADNKFLDKCFGTSYFNFISDHKAIVLRLTSNSTFTPQILEKITFDSELHLKKKKDKKVESKDNSQEEISNENIIKDKTKKNQKDKKDNAASNDFEDLNEGMCIEAESPFGRNFNNPDMATCWLNSCLQLLLIAMDYKENNNLDSELGMELMRLHGRNENLSLDPSNVKDIIVFTEDTRVASRLSRLLAANNNEDVIAEQSRIIQESRFDLHSGQQCVRDFFLCINENLESWPDVFSMLAFRLTHTSKCKNYETYYRSARVQLSNKF